MAQKRHVISLSLDDELLADIDYCCNTATDDRVRSREIEKILRRVIPSRRLSVSAY
jgi:metal-responsive CopG/Arc/MetJ family transcriptional regulator